MSAREGSGIDPDLLDILVCPLTRTPLRWNAAASELISDAAGLAYTVQDGVPIMVPELARRVERDGALYSPSAIRLE